MRVTVAVTGASRGLGRAVAVALCEGWHAEGHTVRAIITARTAQALEAVKQELGASTHSVVALTGDLSRAEDVKTLTQQLLDQAKLDECDRFVLINNAGTLGDISKRVSDYDNLEDIHAFMMTNVSSKFYLTSRFLKALTSADKQGCIVNISSLLAVEGHGGFGLYCASRAARDMYTAVAAKEAADSKVTLLSYAPGPLDTDMQTDIRARLANDDLRAAFADMKEKGTLVTPASSAGRLFELLQRDDFASGAHIDFYDKEYPKRSDASSK